MAIIYCVSKRCELRHIITLDFTKSRRTFAKRQWLYVCSLHAKIILAENKWFSYQSAKMPNDDKRCYDSHRFFSVLNMNYGLVWCICIWAIGCIIAFYQQQPALYMKPELLASDFHCSLIILCRVYLYCCMGTVSLLFRHVPCLENSIKEISHYPYSCTATIFTEKSHTHSTSRYHQIRSNKLL